MANWKRRLAYGMGLLCIVACSDSNETEPQENEIEGMNSGVTETGLVGTWEQTYQGSTKTLTLNADGSCQWVEFDEECTWSVKGNVLTMAGQEAGVYENEDGTEVSYSETETWSISISVVDNKLYFETLNRVSGSGAGVAGTWKTVEVFSAEGTANGVSYSETLSKSTSIEASGVSYSRQWSQKGLIEDQTVDASETTAGSVLQSGSEVLFVPEENADGFPLNDPFYYDLLADAYGRRLTDDIILLSVFTDDHVAEAAYVKVE